MNESWGGLIETGRAAVMCEVLWRQRETRGSSLLLSAPPPPPSSTPAPPLHAGGGGLVCHVRGTAETKRGQGGGRRTSTNQVPPSLPRQKMTAGVYNMFSVQSP